MKDSRFIIKCILAFFLVTFSLNAFTQSEAYSYAYIEVSGKSFSKKLKVITDFGDTPEQITKGQEYSEILSSKKTYAAILNYMAETQFELVETLVNTSSFNGSGGTSGVVFIMRKKRTIVNIGS